MKKTLVLICGLLLLLTSACHRKDKVEAEPHWFRHYTVYKAEKHQQFFNENFDDFRIDSSYQASTKQYYQERDFTPIWTLNGLQEHKVDSLLAYLEQSYQHGLPASYFGYDELVLLIDSLKKHTIPNDDNLYRYLSNLEMKLTTAYLRYATALQFGATDPKVANGGKWLYQTNMPDSTFYRKALVASENFLKALQELQPKNPIYKRLQQEMLRLRPIQDTSFVEIPAIVAKVGDHNPNLKLVSRRLKITGELPAQYRDTTLFTSKLLQAINQFRSDNNIPTSDSLDQETIEKLNRPIHYYTDKLAANMERLRWQVAPQKGENHIAVNLPDFTLQTYYEGEMVFKTRICCGKTQNPKADPSRMKNGLVKAFKAETPLLHSEINTIVLNPEWSIPYDILKNEYYPKLCRSNTACVKREHLYIRDHRTGKFVVPDSIDWTKVSQDNIPYRLYQTSGRYNALGQVKFSFPNSQSVYLHDTNNKGAFKHRKRTFSHGCVRVENPFDLAAVIYELNGYDSLRTEQYGILVGQEPVTEEGEKYLEKLQERDSIREANLTDEERPFYRKLKPTAISLKNKMPVYIEYYTCFVGDDNRIQYRDDIYYKDDNILTLLNRLKP